MWLSKLISRQTYSISVFITIFCNYLQVNITTLISATYNLFTIFILSIYIFHSVYINLMKYNKTILEKKKSIDFSANNDLNILRQKTHTCNRFLIIMQMWINSTFHKSWRGIKVHPTVLQALYL